MSPTLVEDRACAELRPWVGERKKEDGWAAQLGKARQDPAWEGSTGEASCRLSLLWGEPTWRRAMERNGVGSLSLYRFIHL